MDPVELSSTKTPLQVYNSLCIRLKNFVARLKVLIFFNEVEKCRQQLLRIKEMYFELVSLNIGEENCDIKPSKPEIGYLVLDACEWVRSLEERSRSLETDFGCHEEVKQSSETELICNKSSSTTMSAMEFSPAPPSSKPLPTQLPMIPSHCMATVCEPILTEDPKPIPLTQLPMNQSHCDFKATVCEPIPPDDPKPIPPSQLPMNPSHCMDTVYEPNPPEDPKPIIMGNGHLCSPPPLMSLHVRIPPLMSLSVFPWFCPKIDASLSKDRSFNSPSSVSPNSDTDLPSRLTYPFDCVSTVVAHPPKSIQPSTTPAPAVEFSCAPPSSQPLCTKLSTSLHCTPRSPSQVSFPCSPFQHVIQPSTPVSLTSPNRFGLLWQFISSFLCNLLGFYHLFRVSILCS